MFPLDFRHLSSYNRTYILIITSLLMSEIVVPVLSQFVGPKIPQAFQYSFRFVFF
jgi:hypothetical protein